MFIASQADKYFIVLNQEPDVSQDKFDQINSSEFFGYTFVSQLNSIISISSEEEKTVRGGGVRVGCMNLLYPFLSHHLLSDGRLTLGADRENREGPFCWVGTSGGQEIARLGYRKDSLTTLLQGAESRLQAWYEAQDRDCKRGKPDQNMSYKLRFTVDFIRDQGKVELGDQRGLCCVLRTLHGHTVWHGGNKAMGLNTLLWEVEKQLTQHYNRVGWQCRSPEEEMMTIKRKASSPVLLHAPSPLKLPLNSPPIMQLPPQPKISLNPHQKAQQDAEDKEMAELFKQLQHLHQMQQVHQQQSLQQQQHMYHIFFEQVHRQQQQQQQLFQHLVQVLMLQQNLEPSEIKIDMLTTPISPLSPPSDSTPTTPKTTKPRKKAKK